MKQRDALGNIDFKASTEGMTPIRYDFKSQAEMQRVAGLLIELNIMWSYTDGDDFLEVFPEVDLEKVMPRGWGGQP